MHVAEILSQPQPSPSFPPVPFNTRQVNFDAVDQWPEPIAYRQMWRILVPSDQQKGVMIRDSDDNRFIADPGKLTVLGPTL